MNAIERLAREGRDYGELASDAVIRFPQLIGAPVVLNLSAILEAYLDLVFGSVIDAGSALSEDKI
jgi:hypothetical protein